MPRIRILVVDDSVVSRRFLCNVLASTAEIEVAGTASNGAIALATIPQLNPDVITLDVEMPGLDGIETLAEIRKHYPKLPVIMFSALTERGAVVTLEALSLGASDYVTKPSHAGSTAEAIDQVRRELIPKILLLAEKQTIPQMNSILPRATSRGFKRRVDILAIGTSTGGPNALAEVIPKLPKDFPVPIVIVQHLPPLFTRLLAERLNSRSQLRVAEGIAGRELGPGDVWIAPGDCHLVLRRAATGVVLGVNQDPPENCCRPAVDVLFRSVAEVYGSCSLALVMTGMGSDGARGAELIHKAGGSILAQDQDSSVVWGMAGAIVNAGLVDKVCPLREISGEIVHRVQASRGQYRGNATSVTSHAKTQTEPEPTKVVSR